MSFFQNAHGFTISGGTFSIVHGDVNQEFRLTNNFMANSHNNYDYQGPQPPQPPRRRPYQPPPRNPQHFDFDNNDPWESSFHADGSRTQRGPSASAQFRYGEDVQADRHFDGRRDRRQRRRNQNPASGTGTGTSFDEALRDPSIHVEIDGAGYRATPSAEYQVEHPEETPTESTLSEVASSESSVTVEEEGEDATMSDSSAPSTFRETASPVDGPAETQTDVPVGARPTVEGMRRKMANMDIQDEGEESEDAVKAPEGFQTKPKRGFGKIFSRRSPA
ncbi:hypothetical protein C8F01DRAFT_1141600 [Mycena amicta]|nr:hypothetical protein C8F01DRAFT_1141600 [Mycena amicta]